MLLTTVETKMFRAVSQCE